MRPPETANPPSQQISRRNHQPNHSQESQSHLNQGRKLPLLPIPPQYKGYHHSQNDTTLHEAPVGLVDGLDEEAAEEEVRYPNVHHQQGGSHITATVSRKVTRKLEYLPKGPNDLRRSIQRCRCAGYRCLGGEHKHHGAVAGVDEALCGDDAVYEYCPEGVNRWLFVGGSGGGC